MLPEQRLIVRKAGLDVMNAVHIGEIHVPSGIREPAILANRFALQVRAEISERVARGVVVELVLPHECAQRKEHMRAKQMRPCGSNIERPDFGPLILRSHRQAVGTQAVIVHHHSRPCGGVLSIEGIGRLEPGTRVAQIEIDGVGLRRLEVDAVENVCLVPIIVHHRDFRAIQKPIGAHPIGGYEIAPRLSAIGQVEACAPIGERAIGRVNLAVRLGLAESGASSHHDHQAGLVPVFGRRRALDHFHRLHRIQRNLVRESLALLVGNLLSVHRKRVGRVIAEAVEHTIGIR